MTNWLALVIGNTHWHWAWFRNDELQRVWHLPHRQASLDLSSPKHPLPAELLTLLLDCVEVWAISVVPKQAEYLATYPSLRWIQKIPLKGIYSTMGLDRVVSLCGAGQHYGWPVLVIDGGTALTFTAGAENSFKGGAILLGVRSHLKALHHHTAVLPNVSLPNTLPIRWAGDTPEAIQSGVLYPLLAGIQDFILSWQHQYADTNILFTGGDGQYLCQLYKQYLEQQNQVLNNRTWFDQNLMFWGIADYRSEATRAL